MKNLLLVVSMICVSFFCIAQNEMANLAFFADVMINAEEKTHRITAHRSFKPIFEMALASPSSFEEEFENLRWISKQYPQDSAFRLFSWQLELDENNYEYYAYLQRDNGEFVELKYEQEDLEDLPYMKLLPDEWVGCLYYKIHQFDQADERKYVLFGYNAYNKYESIKFADILNLDEDGISFGNPVFMNMDSTGTGDVLNRIILKYSSDSNVNLNYNPTLDMVVFDHLIPMMGRMEGQGPTMVSDGSYSGYKLDDKGNWIFKEKLFDHVYEEAPRPKPVFKDDDEENGKG